MVYSSDVPPRIQKEPMVKRPHAVVATRAALIARGGKRRSRKKCERREGKVFNLPLGTKVVRFVRTPEGERRFGQPIGTIIVRDKNPLKNIRFVPSEFREYSKLEGVDGSTWYMGKESDNRWYLYEGDNDSGWSYPTQEALLEDLDSDLESDQIISAKPSGMHPATAEERKKYRIPPAWTDVFISDDPDNAALVAKGRDVKGRMQPLYSAAHHANQAEKKFQRIKELHDVLPRLDGALKAEYLENDTAAALLLSRKMGLRPGSTRNTKADTQAFGATTLQAKHVKVTPGGQTNFDFTGKKGVKISLKTKDPMIADLMRKKLATRSRNDSLFDTSDDKANAYMKEKTGGAFLVKDLRTYYANALAMREIEKFGKKVPKNKTEYRKMRNAIGDAVAAQLGNTRTLALNSYINPAVFAKWDAEGDFQ